jgi:hypothetical protein
MRSLMHILTLVLTAGSAAPSNAPLVRPAERAFAMPTWATREYRLTRIERSPDDIMARARSVLTLFSSAQPDDERLERWAEKVVSTPHEMLQFHPLPDAAPGVVVMYHPWEDDLMVMDVQQLQMTPTLDHGAEPVVPDEGIGEIAARSAMFDALATLERAGVLPSGYSAASARLGVWRERESRGLDHLAEWIVEYQLTMNRIVDGLEVIDAGVRIGIHRSGGLSSIRVTDVEITPVSTTPSQSVTVSEAREALVAAEHGRFPDASLVIERERLGLLLGPRQETVLSAPCVVFDYSLRFEGGLGPAAVSRQKIATVSLFSGLYAQVYPVPAIAE